MLSEFPPVTRSCFRVLGAVSGVLGKDLKLPREVINRYLCNGMEPMEIVQTIGFFGALPTRVFRTRVDPGDLEVPCPVTYITLTRDLVLPVQVQQRMAGRIPRAEILEIESCHQVAHHRPKELADILLCMA